MRIIREAKRRLLLLSTSFRATRDAPGREQATWTGVPSLRISLGLARHEGGGAWVDAGIGATVTDVRRSARALGGNGPAQALETVLLLFFVGSWTLANCVVLAPGPELVCFF
jgi:hypothetical protein